jgi:malonate decarboxylase epsilon subunit
MLQALREDSVGRETLDQAAGVIDALIRVPVDRLDSAEVLAGTVGAQLALLVAGVASGRTIVRELGRPRAVAGHSVGAFAAAVIAGVLTFEEAIRVVHVRAQTMERLFPSGHAMAAVTGLSPLAARRLAVDIDPVGDRLWVANVNSDDQTVFAGCLDALDQLDIRAAGAGARRVLRLAVSVPSHGVAMAPVVEALVPLLDAVDERPGSLPCSSNVTGRLLHTAAAVREDLALLSARPVQWRDAVAILVESGVDAFVQARPGRALIDLAARQHADVASIAVCDTPAAELAAWAARQLP